MHRTLPIAAFSLCAAVALPASAQVLVHSFEGGDLTSPINAELRDGIDSSGFDTIGATDGAASYRLTATAADTSGGFRSLLRFNLYDDPAIVAALQDSPTIEFDVTVGPDNNPNDAFGFTKIGFFVNSPVAGFEGYFGSDYQINFGESLHVVYELSTAQAAAINNPANSFTQLTIGTNSFEGVAPTVYIDNITAGAVPEPASLALLGLGGVAMLAGRRRG